MGIWDDLKLQYRIGGVVQKILFWNIGVSLCFLILKTFLSSVYSSLLPWFGLSSNYIDLLFAPWTLVSYSFLHAGIIHLLFNLLVLHFVGRMFTTYFTQRQFATVYFCGAVIGGLFYLLGAMFFSVGSILVGASAAIMTPLIALAVYAPYMEVRLALIGYVKMWHIAAFIIVLDVIQLSTQNTGGHLSHLGGAFMGFLYIKLLNQGVDISKKIDSWQHSVIALFKKKSRTPFKKVYVSKQKTARKTNSAANKAFEKTVEQKKIDEILDKISRSGYESLTKEEKDFLFKVGK